MTTARTRYTAASFLLFTLVACSAGRRASLGGECELNSECDAPLVCRLGFCRNECATSADCSRGLSCVLDAQRLGICQLAEEASCTLASECPAPLSCRFGECTNECNEDRDCLGGARLSMTTWADRGGIRYRFATVRIASSLVEPPLWGPMVLPT